nr:hypothetical protein [Tanacetum cinerariifolium]
MAMDEALVPNAQRLRIGRSNFRLLSDIKSKESTLQLVYDVLRICPFFKAFLVTVDVPEIYMQEFWVTTTVHHHAIRFMMDNKKHIMNLESFKDMLHICPRVPGAAPPKTKASVRRTKSSSDTSITPPTAAAEAQQTKLVTKRSLQQTHISQVSGSGVDEGTGSIPGVLDVPTEESEKELSWNSTDDEGDDDGKDGDVDDDDNGDNDEEDEGDDGEEGDGDDDDEDDDGEEGNDDDDDQEVERDGEEEGGDDDQEFNEEEYAKETRDEKRHNEEEEEDELYRDVNINQGRGIQATLEVEDSHVTLTPVNPDGQQQSSSVSSQFVTSMLNPTLDVEMELKMILIEKIEGNKSIQRSDEQRNLYKALVKAYESDKIILDTYGETVTLKRRRDDDADKDEEPSAGPDRGSKRRREGKEPESALVSESAFTEEPMQTTCQMEEPSHLEFDTGAEDQPIVQSSQHPEWFSQQQKPPSPDHDWNKTVPAIHRSIQPWIRKLAKQTNTRSSFNELMDTPLDFSNFLINRLKVDTLTLKLLAGPTYELMKGSCKSLVELEYHLEEVFKATTDQLDWAMTSMPSGESPIGGQQFYSFVVNWECDVYSKRRIIAVTELKIDQEELREVYWRKAVRGRLQDATKDHMIYRMLFLSFKSFDVLENNFRLSNVTYAIVASMLPIYSLSPVLVCGGVDRCVTVNSLQCDPIVVCELLLGLQPWQSNPDSKCEFYTSFVIMLAGAVAAVQEPTPTVTSSTDSQMHNNIMAAGSRDRPPMLATGRYPQWIQAVAATDESPAIPEHTTVETSMNMSPANKAHFKAEKEAIHLTLTGIGDEIYSTVDACQTTQEIWEAIERQSSSAGVGDSVFNCKEFGHFAKECRKPKRVKDFVYHKEKMLLCKQAEQGVLLQAEQYDWQADTDEEINEQELEAHDSYMEKIQEVPTANSGTDSEPLEQVQNEAGYNVFANEIQHSEQSESISNTCLVETDDCNVIPDSLDMCEDDIQNDQNDVESDDERVALANLKLDVDENKKIQKQLKKANTTLAHELKECKTILAKTSKTLGESISVRDSCLVSLQNKQTEFEKYKAFNDRTVDYDKLERKLNETLGQLALKDIE